MRVLSVHDAWDGEQLGSVPAPDLEQVLQDVAASPKALNLSISQRVGLLRSWAHEIEIRSAALALLATRESGVPLKTTTREVSRTLRLIRLWADYLSMGYATGRHLEDADGLRRIAISERWPIGRVLAVCASNRPLYGVCSKVAASVALNNVCVVKLSEKVPLTGQLAMSLLEIPVQLRPVVDEDHVVVRALLDSHLVDALWFTGSSDVAESLHVPSRVRTILELGDSSPLLALDEGLVESAAVAAAAGSFSGSGLSCRAVKRNIVIESVVPRFAKRVAELASGLRVGDPREPETDVGPLPRHLLELATQRINAAVENGARLVWGGRRDERCLWPTVLTGVQSTEALVTDETLAPVAPIIAAASIDEAIGLADASQYGLQLGVFTDSWKVARLVFERVRTGTVVVNGGPQYDSPLVPFGGMRRSGVGREGVPYLVSELSQHRTMVVPA